MANRGTLGTENERNRNITGKIQSIHTTLPDIFGFFALTANAISPITKTIAKWIQAIFGGLSDKQ